MLYRWSIPLTTRHSISVVRAALVVVLGWTAFFTQAHEPFEPGWSVGRAYLSSVLQGCGLVAVPLLVVGLARRKQLTEFHPERRPWTVTLLVVLVIAHVLWTAVGLLLPSVNHIDPQWGNAKQVVVAHVGSLRWVMWWTSAALFACCGAMFCLQKRASGKRCHDCNYDLSGLTVGRCPECGKPASLNHTRND